MSVVGRSVYLLQRAVHPHLREEFGIQLDLISIVKIGFIGECAQYELKKRIYRRYFEI